MENPNHIPIAFLRGPNLMRAKSEAERAARGQGSRRSHIWKILRLKAPAGRPLTPAPGRAAGQVLKTLQWSVFRAPIKLRTLILSGVPLLTGIPGIAPGDSRLQPRRILAFIILLVLVAMAGIGCHGLSANDLETERGYQILEFTLLGDSAVALRIESWEARNPPDTAPWPRTSFALLDRERLTIRPLGSLPASAGPTFPGWFFACDSGRPVSVHPRGYFGPAGACAISQVPAISPEGYALAFADGQGRVNLLSRELEPITFRATRDDSAMPLEYASAIGRVFILEWHGRGDTVLWRGFANDDPSGSDSSWLVRPDLVRVHGAGTRLICNEADKTTQPLACWSAGVTGFREAFAEATSSPIVPEWDPTTGKLAWLGEHGRFVFLDPETGNRKVIDAGPLLKTYQP
jgi:hypothetical protein